MCLVSETTVSGPAGLPTHPADRQCTAIPFLFIFSCQSVSPTHLVKTSSVPVVEYLELHVIGLGLNPPSSMPFAIVLNPALKI